MYRSLSVARGLTVGWRYVNVMAILLQNGNKL